jgi:hypothetical protein
VLARFFFVYRTRNRSLNRQQRQDQAALSSPRTGVVTPQLPQIQKTD